ncbi:MAG: aldehyde dehydrogenase family protein, partial [Asgard group archaeon]|nr:aldehyde dehydrogenase family protein [Asgard group archaeon]
MQSEKKLITNSNKITKDQIKSIIKNQNNYFSSGNTKTYEFRISQLKIIKEMLMDNQDEIIKMIQLDLKRPTFEIYTADYMVLIKEINYIIKNLKKWMKNKKIKKPLLFFKSTTYVESLPYGVSLLVSPWNYPINLIIKPLLYNIAAGNTA